MTTVQFFLVLAGFVGGGAILINVVLGAIVRLAPPGSVTRERTEPNTARVTGDFR